MYEDMQEKLMKVGDEEGGLEGGRTFWEERDGRWHEGSKKIMMDSRNSPVTGDARGTELEKGSREAGREVCQSCFRSGRSLLPVLLPVRAFPFLDLFEKLLMKNFPVALL